MPGIPATTSIANWSRANQHVEAAIRSGRYINAETTLVFAGPPRISDIGLLSAFGTVLNSNGQANGTVLSNAAGQNGRDALYPIGLLESVSISQAQTVQKMFEIGSRRSYQAGGRVFVQGSMGRVMFNGPSLMRALYAYYPNTVQMANGRLLGKGGDNDSISVGVSGAGEAATNIFPPIYLEPGSFANKDPEDASGVPHSVMLNLMSELFSHPFGFGLLMRDNKNQNYGALYLEDCFITSHNFGVSSSSTLITETLSFQCDAAIPMEFNTGTGAQIAQLGRLA